MKKGQVFLCWFTIGLAIIAIMATFFVRIIPTVTITGETYIGVLVSLLGICVTLAIGYQIVNTLDLKESIREMKSLKHDLEGMKKEMVKIKYQMRAEQSNSEGIAASQNGDYPLGLYNFTTGLKMALKCDDGTLIPMIIDNIKEALNIWNVNRSYYDPSKFNSLHIGYEKPIDIIVSTFDDIIDNCFECVLYDSHIKQIKECKARCEQKIKEHNEWLEANKAKKNKK
jgi:hypothetical protein